MALASDAAACWRFCWRRALLGPHARYCGNLRTEPRGSKAALQKSSSRLACLRWLRKIAQKTFQPPRGVVHTIASIEYVLGAASRGCPTDKWPPTSPSSVARRAASSRRSGSATSNNAARRAAQDRESLVRPVAAAAQAQGAAARKGLGAGRRADAGDHRDRAHRRGQVVGRRHLAARDALVVTHRYWQDWGTTPPPPRGDGIDRASVFRLWQCVRLLRAGRGPPGASQKEEIGPVRRHRNDGHGGPRAVRARPAPGREITGVVRPAVHRVCWRRKRRKKTTGGPGQPRRAEPPPAPAAGREPRRADARRRRYA